MRAPSFAHVEYPIPDLLLNATAIDEVTRSMATMGSDSSAGRRRSSPSPRTYIRHDLMPSAIGRLLQSSDHEVRGHRVNSSREWSNCQCSGISYRIANAEYGIDQAGLYYRYANNLIRTCSATDHRIR